MKFFKQYALQDQKRKKKLKDSINRKSIPVSDMALSHGIEERFRPPEVIIGMFKPDQDEIDQKIYEGIVEYNID